MPAPEITAAAITGFSTIAASGIAALAGALIGRKLLDQNKMREQRDAAVQDVAFLLAV